MMQYTISTHTGTRYDAVKLTNVINTDSLFEQERRASTRDSGDCDVMK